MSSGQRVSLQAAYVLHQRPFQDSGILLEVFSAEHGRLGLIAKGVRKKRGRWQSELQPFVPLLLSWTGRGELPVVTGVELYGELLSLSGKYLLSAFYINELMMHLLHRHDPYPGLFQNYHSVLIQLARLSLQSNAESQQLERVLRLFEKKLLEEVGYGVVWDCDSETGEVIQPGQQYVYKQGTGVVSLQDDNEENIYQGRSLLALQAGQLQDAESLRDAKRLLRTIIDQMLDGRELKSRKMILDLMRTTSNNAAT